jgi:F-box protein 9
MVTIEEEETDELRRFRENWRRELEEKKRLQQPRQDSAPHPAAAEASTSDKTSEANSLRQPGLFHTRNGALEVYSRAVKHEQAGELDDALRLYRQAFRADSNVDRLYHLREQRAARTPEAVALAASTVEEGVESKATGLVNAQSNSVVPAHHPERQVSGLLASILADFPIPLSFEPEDERAPLSLQRLPDELLVHMLSYLGVVTVERFALVSKKARVITLDPTIWRSDFLLPSSLMCSAVH